MKVVITGAEGFIGRNLVQHLAERKDVEVRQFTRHRDTADLLLLMDGVDVVYHLAGVNRPEHPDEFTAGNVGLTTALCLALQRHSGREGRMPPIVIYASSTQAEHDSPYGRSKKAAELALLSAHESKWLRARIFRLPNVFGKWARPNYNSAVATFCFNVARGLPIEIHDHTAPMTLVYIDDVVNSFLAVADADACEGTSVTVRPVHQTTVGEVATLIQAFRDSRQSLVTERVGTGLTRALHSTYVSYLPRDQFAYDVPKYGDARGVFVEMLKTQDSGQVSFFTAHPGVTRGGHYHHSKTEKFLVIRGDARFRFRHVQTGESHELQTSGVSPVIVETIPGWTHDITNVGADELIVMLWANEIFDRSRPDTIACPI